MLMADVRLGIPRKNRTVDISQLCLVLQTGTYSYSHVNSTLHVCTAPQLVTHCWSVR
jgi:hypothetical protein